MNEPQSKVSNSEKNQSDAQFKPTAEGSALSEAKPISQLTPEEQMALYEKELKESDWGHQPC